MKAVAVLGLNVISLGVTANTGGIDFLEDPKKKQQHVNQKIKHENKYKNKN